MELNEAIQFLENSLDKDKNKQIYLQYFLGNTKLEEAIRTVLKIQFTYEELIIINSLFQSNIKEFEDVQDFLSDNGVFVLNRLKNINKKINKYMEEKENGISNKL